MRLEGSCHCSSVRFTVRSAHPYPYNSCYCSICRKTAGGGGYAINLGADYGTLDIHGQEHIGVYRPGILDSVTSGVIESPAQRSFCRICGSALWVWDTRWPDLVHPFASAIDTELPIPPERVHMMLEFKAPWVEVHAGARDQKFDGFPQESLAEWHRRLDLEDSDT